MRRVTTVVFVLFLVMLIIAPALAAVSDTPPSAVFPGDENTFMRKGDGSLWAWGSNSNGQLGDGTYLDRYAPVLIKNYADLLGGNLTGVTVIRSGQGYTVALKADGTLLTSGADNLGQLGDPNRTDLSVFALVPGIGDVTRVDAGEGHVLALKGDGTVWSWGDNSDGQLGNGSYNSGKPARVTGIQGIRAIAAGGSHSVATRGMETYAWGNNLFGQLGDGTNKQSDRPVIVPIHGVTDLAAGEYHTMALLDDGTVWAWGGNGYGQLGNDTVGNSSSVPVKVEGLRNVKAIAASDGYSLALLYNGTVWAWGHNGKGALGAGSVDGARHAQPVQIKGLYDITQINAAPGGCVAKDMYGNIWVWGINDKGQLGDGTRTDRLTPVPWYPEMAPWWSPATPTPIPVTPTPAPTRAPTPTPAPAPGIAVVLVALLGAYLLAGRK